MGHLGFIKVRQIRSTNSLYVFLTAYCTSACLFLLVTQEHLLKVDDLVRPLQPPFPVPAAAALIAASAATGRVVIEHHLEGGAVALADGGADVDSFLSKLDVGILGQVDLVRAEVIVPLNDDHVAVLDHRHFELRQLVERFHN